MAHEILVDISQRDPAIARIISASGSSRRLRALAETRVKRVGIGADPCESVAARCPHADRDAQNVAGARPRSAVRIGDPTIHSGGGSETRVQMINSQRAQVYFLSASTSRRPQDERESRSSSPSKCTRHLYVPENYISEIAASTQLPAGSHEVLLRDAGSGVAAPCTGVEIRHMPHSQRRCALAHPCATVAPWHPWPTRSS